MKVVGMRYCQSACSGLVGTKGKATACGAKGEGFAEKNARCAGKESREVEMRRV